MERTLLLIKPDAVFQRKIGAILQRVEEKGYRITALTMRRLRRSEAEAFYASHRGKPFFEPLIEFMTEGPCVPVVVEGEGVIQGLRRLVGATDPMQAEEGTLRRAFGEDGRRNAVHASDGPDAAEKEITFFFGNGMNP